MTAPLYEQYRPTCLADVIGQSKAVYVRLCAKHHNNLRAVLQDIEAGAMKA